MKKNKKMSGGKKMAVSAGLAALTGGAYYFLGPDAKAHQKKASKMVNKVKKEVVSQVKKAKDIAMPIYKKHEGDIQAIAKKLEAEWKMMSKKATKKSPKNSKTKRG